MSKKIRKHMIRRIQYSLCLDTTSFRTGCFGGIILVTISILMRLFSGSPYQAYLIFCQTRNFPPLFLLTTIHLIFSFLLGFVCGLILSDRRRAVREGKYRVGMYFVVMITLWLSVYPFIFRAAMPWVAMLMLISAWALCLPLIKMSFSIRQLCAWIIIIFSCWIFYLILLLFRCLIGI